jgi:ribonuclease HII
MKTPPPDWSFERSLRASGVIRVAGIDEAGRGPLAGPVVAAAVLFGLDCEIDGVRDSKQLSASDRERMDAVIRTTALSVGVGVVDEREIDRINILNATMKAMHSALAGLSVRPEHVLIDGNRYTPDGTPFTTIVKGDTLSISIAAASIIAKVARDRMMMEYDARYPGYGFGRHKGYGTSDHIAMIKANGPCPIHRTSFLSNILPLQYPPAAKGERYDESRG